MKRLALLLFVIVSLCGWTEAKFNFRDSSGYVTDGSNTTYVLGNDDAYPVTRGGFTFGWNTIDADSGRDRDNAVDARLAGVNFNTNAASQAEFQVDMSSSGTKTVCLAVGDATADHKHHQYVEVLDNTTSKFVVDIDGDGSSGGTAAGEFADANETVWSTANWPGSNVCKVVTFATTTFILKLGTPSSDSDNSSIAHLSITDGGTTGGILRQKNINSTTDYTNGGMQ